MRIVLSHVVLVTLIAGCGGSSSTGGTSTGETSTGSSTGGGSTGSSSSTGDPAMTAAPSMCSIAAAPPSLPEGGGAVTLTLSCAGGDTPSAYAWQGGFAEGATTAAVMGTLAQTTTFTATASNA